MTVSSSRRRLTAVAVAASTLLLAGCWTGPDAQTNQPYTPANAVNVNFSVDPANNWPALTVRGLALIARSDRTAPRGGVAIMVGVITDAGPSNVTDPNAKPTGDRLVRVLVANAGPVEGVPITVPPGGRVKMGLIGTDTLTSRTDPVAVPALDVQTGSFATVTLVFEKAGAQTVQVPVVPVSAYSEAALDALVSATTLPAAS